jgi:hypothetical protein
MSRVPSSDRIGSSPRSCPRSCPGPRLRRGRGRWRAVALVAVGAAAGAIAPLDDDRAHAEETEAGHTFGVGYKVGNGLGPFGIDGIYRPVSHLAIDVQASYVSNSAPGTENAWGIGFAPMAAVEWKSQGHSPYFGAGLIYKYERLNGSGASASGFFFNTGVQLRFNSGLAVLGGIGVNHLGNGLQGLDGNFFALTEPGWHFNLEAGLRYFF